MSARLPDAYFDRMYADAGDPWELGTRWYEQRKYAITMAVLPYRRYRHAFEPGQRVRIGSTEGTILELTAVSLVLETDQGRASIPAKVYNEETIVLLPAKGANA